MPDNRKQSILGLTDELISYTKRAREQKFVLDEATIDSTFVLTFDRFCLEMLCNVRSMLRAIVQQNSSLPFDQEDGWKFYLHLELHKGLKVINDLQPDHQTWRFTHPTDKGYQLFNTSSAIKAIVIPYQSTKVLEHWKYIGEALQTVQIADKIDRLATRFGLWPEEAELDYYAPVAVKSMWQDVVRWVIFNTPIPAFYRPITRLAEPEVDGIAQWIFAGPPLPNMTQRLQHVKKAPLSPETRIRTWAIYFLTKRGGGVLTEEEACALLEIPEQVYRKQRQRLFTGGSKKRIQ